MKIKTPVGFYDDLAITDEADTRIAVATSVEFAEQIADALNAPPCPHYRPACPQCAEEVVELRAKLERYEAMLNQVVYYASTHDDGLDSSPCDCNMCELFKVATAFEALKDGDKE